MVFKKTLKKLEKDEKLAKKQIPAKIARSATSTCSWIRKTALGLPRRPAVIRAIANGVVVVVVAAVVVPVSLRSSHLPMDAEVVLPLSTAAWCRHINLRRNGYGCRCCRCCCSCCFPTFTRPSTW